MRGFIGGLVIGLVIGVVLAVTGPRSGTSGDNSKSESTLNMTYEKATPVRWKLASAFPSKMPFSGSLGPIMIDRLNKISNGNIAIKFHEPGALVASLDLFDAVASGMIDTALSSSQFWGDKSAAFELFGAVPFGPAITSYMAWFREHDGQQLYQELYHRNNIHSLVCGVTGAAGAGWFEHAITDIKDLRNIKIAATGLAARVYRQIGAITVPLAPSDLKNALASKQVDAVAFSTPTADQYLGLMEFSKHYYFPGWFQQTGFIDLMINLEKWNGLSKNQQKIIETACMANKIGRAHV